MSWQRQAFLRFGILTVSFTVAAQSPAPSPPQTQPKPVKADVAVTLPSSTSSPVAFFRTLLSMSPEERANYLTNRPPQIRERILAKINEYQSLNPDERELRLRATELRWYLLPLLQMDNEHRDAGLAKVPPELHDLVKNRLNEWEILPPTLKEEFLENEHALYYFARVQPAPDSVLAQKSAAQRQQISEQFHQFLELTPEEKEQTLSTLSASEREQMQRTLSAFSNLTAIQQNECVQNYAKFANMSEAERADFLKNAERWSQMSPAERQTWRDLVANVPEWPPLPFSIYPPGVAPGTVHGTTALNRTSDPTN